MHVNIAISKIFVENKINISGVIVLIFGSLDYFY